MPITLVTGNPKKLAEATAILGGAITSAKLDLPEIQSMNLRDIVTAKVRAAFDALQLPVLVEDISVHVDGLRGFPGPFVKFWEQQVTWDYTVATLVAEGEGRRMTITASVAYKDAERELVVEEHISGKLVPRSEGEGWGFDFFFIPDGYEKTFAQMGPDVKNQISHRAKAFNQMREVLKENSLL